MQESLQGAQRGLLMRAVFGKVLTIFLKNHDKRTYESLISIIQGLALAVDKEKEQCGLIVGFAPKLWGDWKNRSIPIKTDVLERNDKFKNSGGDVLLYLKTPDHETAERLLEAPKKHLDKLADDIDALLVGKRRDGRIVGGRYLDSITNPNDPVSLHEDILMDGEYKGSCFGFTQRFEFDWLSIMSNTVATQNQIVGRRYDGTILSQHAASGHIHRANVRDSNGDQRKLLRQALPYGTAHDHSGREKGLMFVAFCNDQQRFEDVLRNLLGNRKDDVPADRLMQMVSGVSGSYWYIPAAQELSISAVTLPDDIYEDPHWMVRSSNKYLFYNSQDYLHRMGKGDYVEDDPPSPRLLSLMARSFNHWRDGWVHRQHIPRLPHLAGEDENERKKMESIPIPIRKGMANYYTLTDVLSSLKSEIAKKAGLLRIYPKELVVGVIPDFTFGRGKEVVPYLSEDEKIKFWLQCSLDEFAAMGHVVPDFEYLVRKGLKNIISELGQRLESDPSHETFFKSCIRSLEGVQNYLRNWAAIAKEEAAKADELDAQNMQEVYERLTRLVDAPPKSFQDAVQLVYSFHCCLHLVGELTAFGRLDQILWPFLEQDSISSDRAQSIIDCLFVKIGENAFVDRAFIYDHVTYGTTSVNGVGGNFPQGGGINQWCQQITVGGYKAADGDPQDASNPVTMLFLKSSRRIPVNAPTLSLRVHKQMKDDLLNEAAKAILSGGAQPILYNDDKLCSALHASGATRDQIGEAWSRNYAADGCYEPMLAGASEFAFNNVAPLLALEQTINQGATYGEAGPEQLRGLKQTFRSPPAKEITSFDQLLDIFGKQVEWLTVQCYKLILQNHGNAAAVCPSPLLSTLIDGCIDKGHDITDGGSRFHIVAPLFVGVSNTIDSLYAIWKLVYDTETACTTLSELKRCLIMDWGFDMIEPYQDQLLGKTDSEMHALRYKELRDRALALPKWGSGAQEPMLKKIGDDITRFIVKIGVEVIRQPHPALAEALQNVKAKFGPDFEFTVTPGIGTFEGYVGDGIPCGASADGRRKGMPIASDLSPAPAAQDLPALPAFRNIYQSMESYNTHAVEYGLSDAAPVDMNIPENFPLEDLQKFVKKYAAGEVGGNLITLTCADLDTYKAASKDPEKYNLLRVRMGGWTEFYSTMFPMHQEQHQRRQYFVSGESVNGAV